MIKRQSDNIRLIIFHNFFLTKMASHTRERLNISAPLPNVVPKEEEVDREVVMEEKDAWKDIEEEAATASPSVNAVRPMRVPSTIIYSPMVYRFRRTRSPTIFVCVLC